MIRSRANHVIAITLLATMLGCKSAPAPTAATAAPAPASATTYPARPTITPLPFKVFHTTDNSITLVTADKASDEQVEAILWQLHDAAHNNTFAALHLPQQVQQMIDKRDPMVWFHIYRGQKCADEKYTTGKLPCGPSYHAAGNFTFGGFTNRNHTDGALLHNSNATGDGPATALWDPN